LRAEGVPEQAACRRVFEMCSGSKAGSYFKAHRLLYHSTLGLRVIKKKKKG